MTIKELSEKIDGTVIAGKDGELRNVTGMYICDMLSHAMAGVAAGDAWVTILNNKNILAVAVLTELACIIIAEGIELENSIRQKADEEGITVISSPHNAYRIARLTGNI